MELKPRNPDRIDRIVELLREAWHLAPDWRLTQLVINASDIEQDYGPLYCLEDDEMEKRLRAAIGGLKRMRQRS